MPVTRDALERALAEVNAKQRPDQQAAVEEHAPDRFRLSFPDRALPEGECIDQDFAEVQFVLSQREGVDAGIIGARFDEDAGRFYVDYEVVEWD